MFAFKQTVFVGPGATAGSKSSRFHLQALPSRSGTRLFVQVRHFMVLDWQVAQFQVYRSHLTHFQSRSDQANPAEQAWQINSVLPVKGLVLVKGVPVV